MIVDTFPVGPLGCNCSIVVDPATKAAVLIDPGGNFPQIRAKLEKAGARVVAIVHTHTHIDHVGATAESQAFTGAPARIHEADRFLYQMLPIQAALIGTGVPVSCEVEGDLVDDGAIEAGGLTVAVMHTPGHTPGSVSFVVAGTEGTVAFTGDTLFRGGIGRTDLWGGDSALIYRSLKGRLLSLADDVRVVPGHGPDTTIGLERRSNPFLR